MLPYTQTLKSPSTQQSWRNTYFCLVILIVKIGRRLFLQVRSIQKFFEMKKSDKAAMLLNDERFGALEE